MSGSGPGIGTLGVSAYAGTTPGSSYPQYFGIFFGVVNNNADPLGKNRCLLQVPQLFGTAVTTWAISLTPLQSPPAVGTVITALFIGGDVDYPVYMVTDPQIVVENVAGNIKPLGTTSSAGTSTKLAAADHVHGNISTSAGDMQADGTAAAGSSGRVADAQHVHPQPSSPTFSGTVTAGQVDTSSIVPPGGTLNVSGTLAVTGPITSQNITTAGDATFNGSQIQVGNGSVSAIILSPQLGAIVNYPNTHISTTPTSAEFNAIVDTTNDLIGKLVSLGLIA